MLGRVNRTRAVQPVLVTALVIAALGAPAAAAVTRATMRAPATVSLTAHLTVHASGLTAGRYGLYLGITKSHPKGSKPIVCSGPVGSTRKVSGTATFSGKLPKFLGCRSGGSGPLRGSITTVPGSYTLVLGVPAGHGAFEGTVLQRDIRVTS